jgi:hypothetical protein
LGRWGRGEWYTELLRDKATSKKMSIHERWVGPAFFGLRWGSASYLGLKLFGLEKFTN